MLAKTSLRRSASDSNTTRALPLSPKKSYSSLGSRSNRWGSSNILKDGASTEEQRQANEDGMRNHLTELHGQSASIAVGMVKQNRSSSVHSTSTMSASRRLTVSHESLSDLQSIHEDSWRIEGYSLGDNPSWAMQLPGGHSNKMQTTLSPQMVSIYGSVTSSGRGNTHPASPGEVASVFSKKLAPEQQAKLHELQKMAGASPIGYRTNASGNSVGSSISHSSSSISPVMMQLLTKARVGTMSTAPSLKASMPNKMAPNNMIPAGSSANTPDSNIFASFLPPSVASVQAQELLPYRAALDCSAGSSPPRMVSSRSTPVMGQTMVRYQQAVAQRTGNSRWGKSSHCMPPSASQSASLDVKEQLLIRRPITPGASFSRRMLPGRRKSNIGFGHKEKSSNGLFAKMYPSVGGYDRLTSSSSSNGSFRWKASGSMTNMEQLNGGEVQSAPDSRGAQNATFPQAGDSLQSERAPIEDDQLAAMKALLLGQDVESVKKRTNGRSQSASALIGLPRQIAISASSDMSRWQPAPTPPPNCRWQPETSNRRFHKLPKSGSYSGIQSPLLVNRSVRSENDIHNTRWNNVSPVKKSLSHSNLQSPKASALSSLVRRQHDKRTSGNLLRSSSCNSQASLREGLGRLRRARLSLESMKQENHERVTADNKDSPRVVRIAGGHSAWDNLEYPVPTIIY